MKKLTLLALLLTLVSLHVAGQNKNCLESLKSGKFTYEGMEGKIEIIRSNDKQVEIYNNGESKLILKIEWINDHEYILTHLESLNAPGCLEKGDSIKTTVVKCEDNKYYCVFTSNKCGNGSATFIKLE